MEVARRLKASIREQTGLTASAGVAPNKFLAKIASGWQKPDGLTVIAPERVERFLQGLPIDALWGVGPVTARRLRAQGILKVTDVRARSLEDLRQLVGSAAEWLHALAHGIDPRPVEPNRPRKSVGSENTFAADLVDPAAIRQAVDGMARDVAGWLTRKGIYGRTVTLKVRYHDFSTITRSDSNEIATQDPDVIAERAVRLLDRTDAGSRPIRLLGVSIHNLRPAPIADVPHAGVARLPFGDR
jgi:DNA polymerase-4